MSITSSMNSLVSRGSYFLSTVANKVKENPKRTAGIIALSAGAYLSYRNAEAIQAFVGSFIKAKPPVVLVKPKSHEFKVARLILSIPQRLYKNAPSRINVYDFSKNYGIECTSMLTAIKQLSKHIPLLFTANFDDCSVKQIDALRAFSTDSTSIKLFRISIYSLTIFKGILELRA